MNIATLFNRYSDDKVLYEVKSENSFNGKSINEIMDCVNNLSLALKNLDIRTGDKVLILTLNRLEMIEVILATFNIGAVAVPVNPQIGNNLIETIIDNVQPDACIFDLKLKPEFIASLSKNCKLYIAIDERNKIDQRNCYSYHSLIQGDVQERVFYDHDESHPAIIIHTSGSSGKPKAIVRSHRVMHKFITHIFELYEGEDLPSSAYKPYVAPLPLSHLGGLNPILTSLTFQKPVYLMRYFEPTLYLKLVSKLGSDSLILVPSMYTLLLRNGDLINSLNFDSLQFCFHIAEACADSVAEMVAKSFNALDVCAYGMTECYSGIGYTPREIENRETKRGSCGKYLFGEIKLIDENGMENKKIGQLFVKNETVEECYLDDALNKEKFQDGWLKTGDIFSIDDDGYFFWKGRADDMFVCKGNNIYPIEIEKIILQNTAIESAYIAPIKDKLDNTIPAIIATTKQEITERELIHFIIQNGPAYAIPQMILFVDEIPTVGPSKVNRRKIAKILQDAYDKVSNPDTPAANPSNLSPVG